MRFSDLFKLGKVKRKANYIVSMTSYHKRFNIVHKTIESIFAQKTYHNFEFHLYLSQIDINFYKGNILKELEPYTQKGLQVFIDDTKQNLKSFKKYFYALRNNPNKTIITIDDDVFYKDYWLEKMIKASAKHPHCIVCYRGHYFSFDPNGNLEKYEDFMKKEANPGNRLIPSLLLMPTGVSGVLYPANSLDLSMALNEEEFLILCPLADDVWLKLASLRKNTKCVQVKDYNIHFRPTKEDDSDSALMDYNIAMGGNDIQIKKCFETYPKELDKLRKEFKIFNQRK